MSLFSPSFAAKLLGVLFFFASIQATAQKDSTGTAASSNLAISLTAQPLYVYSNAIKLDLELQKPSSRFSYVISPELYSGKISDSKSGVQNSSKMPLDRIKGFGLGLHQKLKFKKQLISPYFAYGATYRNQTITYDTEGFVPYEENGLSYFGYGPMEHPIKIQSLLISTVVGVQMLDWDVLLVDAYVGFGYKLADVEMPNPQERHYNKAFYSPAFKGPVMMLGVKIGAQIKK